MISTKSDREHQIIEFVKDNPYCSLDSIFTKGNVPKSKSTKTILDNLVSDKKIQADRTQTGKNRFFINGSINDEKATWESLDLGVHKFKKDVQRIKELLPHLSRACDRFCLLIDLRLRVLVFEHRHSKKLGKVFHGDGFESIMQKYQRFLAKLISEPSEKRIKDFEKWIGSEIDRDMYYLQHHANASVPRSIADKIGISKDRKSYGLTRQTQIHHQESLKPKKPNQENEYDEKFRRLNAERDRILVSNPHTIENELIREVCLKRLDMIKFKRSKGHNAERKILKDTIRQLDENPTLLHDLLKEKEEED